MTHKKKNDFNTNNKELWSSFCLPGQRFDIQGCKQYLLKSDYGANGWEDKRELDTVLCLMSSFMNIFTSYCFKFPPQSYMTTPQTSAGISSTKKQQKVDRKWKAFKNPPHNNLMCPMHPCPWLKSWYFLGAGHKIDFLKSWQASYNTWISKSKCLMS